MIKKLENRRVKEKIIYSEVFASEMSSLGFGHALSFVCMCSQAFVLLFVTRWNYMFYSVPFKFSISCVYFLFFLFLVFFFLNLIHCISFAKHQNESATGIHVLPAILIPACVSSSPAFLMMYSACKLNKQGDNIQP